MLFEIECRVKTYLRIKNEACRFTIQNMAYTQMFIDYLHAKDPYTLKYFDECSVKLPGNGT
jgi:hypothetical protein